MSDGIDITIIPAVYGVARWLPAFIASLEGQQGVDLSRVEVVAVDDGSPDDGLAILQAWARTSTIQVVVLTKENGGQGTARNLGLTVARGEWVTFTDPDDTLDPGYLRAVLACVRANPHVEMVATARWMLDEATGELRDSHPLREMFVEDTVLDLDENPTFFHGSAPSAVFRLDRLREHAVEFHPEIRPNFEDGHFCASYLLTCERPWVAFLGSAVYRYMKRADGSSTLNSSVAQPTRYTVVPRLGYLDVLERGARRTGRPPSWLQEFVLYELSWYFGSETAQGGNRTAAVGETGKLFLGLLGQISAFLDPEVVLAYRGRRFDGVWRDVLLHGVSDQLWHAPYAVLAGTDREQGLRRVITRFHLVEPDTTYLVDGVPVAAVHTKLRSHVYFGHQVMVDRISWVPWGSLEVRVAGTSVEILKEWPAPAQPVPTPLHVTARVNRKRVALQRKAVRKLSRSKPLGGEFEGAWVLLDRVHDARDSAEIVFEHLRVHRPEVNAFFVVEAGTSDHERLSARWGARVVAYGSRRWLRLMLNCTDVISSHADVPVVRPPVVVEALRPAPPSWRVSFLQHGVIKDDLSSWLNPKRLDLFVVSTPGELESVVGDGSSYVYTSREAKLTGLPRFDRLLERAAQVPEAERDLLLVAPTWRHSLVPQQDARQVGGGQRRSVRADFLESEYARQWLGFLSSERLRDAAAAAGVRVAFLPHPNMTSVLELVELPEHVVALSFEEGDVQELFARAAVLVTDYSSMAFNVALLDRPVVYFPFDLEAVQAGAHVGRVGYFDYDRDGFGPVATELPALVSAVEGVLGRGCVSEPVYAQRAAEAFGLVRDGRCTERVVQALLDLRQPAVSATGAAPSP